MEKKTLAKVTRTYTTSTGFEITFTAEKKVIKDDGKVNFEGLAFEVKAKETVMIDVTVDAVRGDRKLHDTYTYMPQVVRNVPKQIKMPAGYALLPMGRGGVGIPASDADALETMLGEMKAELEAASTDTERGKAAEIVAKAEGQAEVLSAAEIMERAAKWQAVHNEGGDGYAPSYGVSREEYEAAKKILKK